MEMLWESMEIMADLLLLTSRACFEMLVNGFDRGKWPSLSYMCRTTMTYQRIGMYLVTDVTSSCEDRLLCLMNMTNICAWLSSVLKYLSVHVQKFKLTGADERSRKRYL